MVQGKKEQAVEAYQKAWKQIDPAVDYRRFVEASWLFGARPAPVADVAASAAK